MISTIFLALLLIVVLLCVAGYMAVRYIVSKFIFEVMNLPFTTSTQAFFRRAVR